MLKKLFWVLLGLAVLFGAIGVASYRHYFEPQQRSKVARSVGGENRSAAPAPRSAPSAKPGASGGSSTTTAETWQTFEMVVNILNVLVGLVGIWLTISGLRMQRAAMAVTDTNRRA
jgi:hypothetical protein